MFFFSPLHIAIVHENQRLIQKLVGLISFSRLTVNTPNNLSQVKYTVSMVRVLFRHSCALQYIVTIIDFGLIVTIT